MRKLPAIALAASVSTTSPIIVALYHRFSLIDHQGTTIQLGAVQAIDSFLRLTSGTHLHEAEAPGLAGQFIRYYSGGFYGSVSGEYFLQFPFRYRIWQTANIQFIIHVLLLNERMLVSLTCSPFCPHL